MSIDLVVPEEVELKTLLYELKKLSWAAADVLMAYARGQEPPYGFQKSLTVEEGGDGPVSAADMAVNSLLISGLKMVTQAYSRSRPPRNHQSKLVSLLHSA